MNKAIIIRKWTKATKTEALDIVEFIDNNFNIDWKTTTVKELRKYVAIAKAAA